MLTLFFRTLIIYFSLFFFLRLTGKRQIGELQLSELITAFLLSELASIPLTDPQAPLLMTLLSIAVLVALEVLLSFWVTKSVTLKRLLDGSPLLLIRDGVPDAHALSQARISLEELLSQMRLKGVCTLEEISYAFLEHNGQISFLTLAKKQPPTAEDLHTAVTENGTTHALIVDGHVSRPALRLCRRTEAWLLAELKKERLSKKQVLLCTLNDAGELRFLEKRPKSKERNP